MLTILQICLAASGRTVHSMAHAIKGRLMLYWVTSCICITLVRSLRAMMLALLPLVGPIMVFLPTQRMEMLRRGSVERLMGKLFHYPFSKCYS
jgi:hypothetical protein